jgi:KipI family sensor histidine kinase inhibitor
MPPAAGAADFQAEPLGEATLLLRFGERIDAALNARVHDASNALRAAALPGVTDLIPAYASLALQYDPAAWSGTPQPAWRAFQTAVTEALSAARASTPTQTQTTDIEIPVRYGGADGPDLDALAARLGLDADTLIARHGGGDYRVAMLGFAPGFPYLLGLDPSLHAPRLANPRTRVPRGSVAIGGAQTGIYPTELPGGWQLIGRTPLVLFDPLRAPACLLAPGDRVRFRAIGAEEFAALEPSAPR